MFMTIRKGVINTCSMQILLNSNVLDSVVLYKINVYTQTVLFREARARSQIQYMTTFYWIIS